MSQIMLAPSFLEFGPHRVIGIAKVAQGPPDCVAAWDGPNGLIARLGEIEPAEGADFLVGICRCLPGVTDGSFEYIAARPAKPEAVIPDGMIEATINTSAFAVFSVAGLSELSSAWGQAMAWLEAHPEWQTYCNKDACDCANHASFELYPATFPNDGKLFLYFPVKKA